MTMAAAIKSRTADAPARTRTGRIARVDVVDDLDSVEAVWRGLEGQGFFTAYQRFDLLKLWQQQVGGRDGALPLIAIAYDGEGRPLLLLPLTLERRHGVRIASFMGGKHSTFNMPVWDRDFVASAGPADIEVLLTALRAHSPADVLALTQQPLRWLELENPLARLAGQPSVNRCPVSTIEPGAPPASRISNSMRRRLKGKERKLERLSGYRYIRPDTDAEIGRLLDWFFQTKPRRMAEQRLPNVFAEPGVEPFVRLACMMPRTGGRMIDIHALECDAEVIALFAGVADGHRFSMMFNTYTTSENSRHSPGLILIRNIVDYYSARGYRALDLGIGSDSYKRLFCKDEEPIFDSFVPLSRRGRLAGLAMSAANRGKRLVKHNRALLGLAQKLRRTFY
jgi:CelD/BcsL family acetyltransferase involved in cellulose biosynthesis